jgi:hypothetical protein
LAVLCTEDHDAHHRPRSYPRHLDLPAEKILEKKISWEAFVVEAKKPKPDIVATVTAYGTSELVHSMQLVFQRRNGAIEFVCSYHLLDGNLDRMTTNLTQEVSEIGPNIPVVLIDSPMPVEHCPCCGTGYSRTLDKVHAAKLTDANWSTHSITAIYVNPDQPSLAISIGYCDETLYSGTLHLCAGTHLHYRCDYYDERVAVAAKPSVRAQATRIVGKVVREFETAHLRIGTGPNNNPVIIEDLNLPSCWEKLAGRRRR